MGIGVQKAGTSWWFDLIASHPKVRTPPVKELHFFDQFFEDLFDESSASRYADYFPRHEGAIAGEWTPRYIHDTWTVPLLARAAPEARMLVLLRDPVERFRSGLAHDLARGAPHNPVVVSTHVDRGNYADQLRHLLAHFERERVLILQYERCLKDPVGELLRTQEFLGLDAFEPTELDRRINVTMAPKPDLPDHLTRSLSERYRAQIPSLLELVDDLDLDLWPSAADR